MESFNLDFQFQYFNLRQSLGFSKFWEFFLTTKFQPFLLIAEFSYKGQNSDELTFSKNDTIKLKTKDTGEYGWWEGEFNGACGVFPSNFVKELKKGPTTLTPASPANEPRSDSPLSQVTTDSQRQPTYNINTQKQSTIPEKSSSKKKEEQPVAVEEEVKVVAEVKIAIAKYSFEATGPDEIEFSKGDEIQILEEKTSDEGWSKGKNILDKFDQLFTNWAQAKILIFFVNFFQTCLPSRQRQGWIFPNKLC